MYSRIRDIEDAFGTCLRVSIAPHPSGAVVAIERMDDPVGEPVMLGLYGAEILTGFIMSARLALPGPMADERVEGHFPARICLSLDPLPEILLEPEGRGHVVVVPAQLWDRLYAELCLVTAHGRELARRADAVLH